MRFDVVPATGPDNSRIPDTLRALPPLDLSEVSRERVWKFDYTGAMWTINGEVADMSVASATIKMGATEIWTMRNEGSTWSHPVHVHFEEFQIIEKNGQPIAANDVLNARKDVLWLGPNDEVKLLFKFRDFEGRYVIHCHNVVHEDLAMMLRWDIVA